MKTWIEAREAYVKDHSLQMFKQPERRMNALKAIEKTLKNQFPELLMDDDVFMNIKKLYFLKLYECFKGSALSGAEKSVIHGLYKFSVK